MDAILGWAGVLPRDEGQSWSLKHITPKDQGDKVPDCIFPCLVAIESSRMRRDDAQDLAGGITPELRRRRITEQLNKDRGGEKGEGKSGFEVGRQELGCSDAQPLPNILGGTN